MLDFKNWKLYLFLFPIISGYLTSKFCPVGKDAGIQIASRPPSGVFAIVWPILYLCLGYYWVMMRNGDTLFMKGKLGPITITDVLMLLTIFGLVSWIILYGCKKNKKNSLYMLLLILVLAFMLFGYGWSKRMCCGMIVTPFLSWIIFATMLNYSEVNLTLE